MSVELSTLPEGTRFQRRGHSHLRTGEMEWLPESIYAYNDTMTAGPPCKRGVTSREVWPETEGIIANGKPIPGPYWIADNWLVEVL